MGGISAAERERREARDARIERARIGPPASWGDMRGAIEAAEEAVAYAALLAARRADSFAVDEARAIKRKLKNVERQAFGGSQVYVIKRKGARLVKIGVTRQLDRRMRALATGAGAELELLVAFPGEREDERTLHDRFDAYRKRGEWFEYAGPIERWVKEMRAGGYKHG